MMRMADHLREALLEAILEEEDWTLDFIVPKFDALIALEDGDEIPTPPGDMDQPENVDEHWLLDEYPVFMDIVYFGFEMLAYVRIPKDAMRFAIEADSKLTEIEKDCFFDIIAEHKYVVEHPRLPHLMRRYGFSPVVKY